MRVYLFCLLLASLWLPYPALLSVLAMHLLLRLLGLLLPAARHLAWRAEQALGFVGWYAGQLLIASLQVAWLALSRPAQVAPAIVAVQLAVDNPRQATLIAALLTLTPGSLALDYRPGQRCLFLHLLDCRQAEQAQQAVDTLQARLLGWLRRHPAEISQ
jgi:multisubunit Na+/H+ antiporter MnhE subunit